MENPPSRLLLELPILVLEKILKKLTPRNLIAFSFTSINATRICKAIRQRIDRLFIFIQFESDRVMIKVMKVGIRGVPEYEGGLAIYNKDLPFNDKSLIYSSNYELGINTGRRAFDLLLVSHCRQQQMEAVKLSLQHICAIYRSPVKRITVDTNSYPKFTELFIWKHLKTCDDVEFVGTGLEASERNKFFRIFEVKNRLKVWRFKGTPKNINDNINLSLHFSKLRNLKLVDLYSAPWFSNHHLLKVNNRVIDVRNTKITSVGVNKWLKAWMTRRTDEKMIAMKIHAQKPFDRAVVLRDIPWVDEDNDPRVKNLALGTFYLSCIQGKPCITRRDGSVAHVQILRSKVQIYIRYPGVNF